MNFKILFVNGQDLSGSSHKDAVAAFQAASEPISVVLARSTTSSAATPIYGRNEVGTQTDLPCYQSCACQSTALSESCQNAIKSLTALMSFQTELHEQTKINSLDCLEHEEDTEYDVDYQEVELRRNPSDAKLGITLCDGTNGYSEDVKVIVSEVAQESIAGRSHLIHEGDQILKVNGVRVNNTFEAGKLLKQENGKVILVLGRPRRDSLERWSDDDDVIIEENEDGVIDDVTQPIGTDSSNMCACPYESEVDVCLEQENADMEYAAIRSQMDYKGFDHSYGGSTKLGPRDDNSYSRTDTNGKDSGVGRTDESIQNSENGTLDSSVLPPCDQSRFNFSGQDFNSVCPSANHEFQYRQYSQENANDTKTTASRSSIESMDSAKGSSMGRSSVSTSKQEDCETLQKAMDSLEIENQKRHPVRPRRASNVENLSDQANDNVSPWARMSLLFDDNTDFEYGDLESKGELIGNGRINERWPCKSANSPSDNSSSAYNTGESLSSATSPGSVDTPPTKENTSRNVSSNNLKNKSLELVFAQSSFGGPECCLSSDANSDVEEAPCYVTNEEDNGMFSSSDCFEDAAVDFTLHFSSNKEGDEPLRRLRSSEGCPAKINASSVVPDQFSRRRSAPCTGLPLANAKLSLPAEKQRHGSKSVETTSPSKKGRKSHKSHSRKRNSSRIGGKRDRSGSETIAAPSASESTSTFSQISNKQSNSTRRTSESPKTESQYESCTTETANDPKVEWKVRVRSDGTRYITKRPVRERILREREAKLNKERNGLTTDDDAMTELKLGRYWSKDERKKHLERVREHKKRKDFMQRCRLDALRESGNEEDIVQLSHQKMLKKKNKRILDDFMTVQEILAHGNRCLGGPQPNPLLTVTYI